jgi:hypothetical protein
MIGHGARVALLGLGLAAAACASGRLDVGALEAIHPELAGIRDHRLEDAVPYFAPAETGLALILCRWSTEVPIPVWLPSYASAGETRAIEQALDAWEAAGLGLRFARRPWSDEPPLAGIVFEILDTRREGPAGSADTIADCAVPTALPDGETLADPVDAELQYASIHLRRELLNELGRAVPLTETELVGAVAHELGHALGLAGHVASPGSLMSSHGQVDAARRFGSSILEGRPLEVPTLSAVYALPPGTRVGWLPLTRVQLEPLIAVGAAAAQAGLRGPWVRVGTGSARILWRYEAGESAAVVIVDWEAALRDPALFEGIQNRLARLLVEPGSS